MSTPYCNAVQIQLNEVTIIEFIENSQNGRELIAKIAMAVPTLKDFHKVLGDAIEQYDKKLNELKRTKDNMN